ncbi:MAG: hypothetical protein ACRENM_01125, partial [Candidatus Dormibacteraceae bacterium]
LVLIHWSIRHGRWRILAAVAAAVLLMSPAHTALIDAIGAGLRNDAILEGWAAAGPLGILVLWLASLAAIGRGPAPEPSPAREAVPTLV